METRGEQGLLIWHPSPTTSATRFKSGDSFKMDAHRKAMPRPWDQESFNTARG